jgi:hypothetical protein
MTQVSMNAISLPPAAVGIVGIVIIIGSHRG